MEVAELDAVWKALSDPTRRQVLDLLRAGPRTTGDLCARFPDLSRFGVMKHLSVLEAAGLILVRPRGRERWNHLNAVPIQQLYERWISPYEGHWASSLLRLKRAAEAQKGHVAMTTGTLSAQVIETGMEVVIAAPRSRVFEALTRETSAWWGEPFVGMAPTDKTVDVVLDPKLGGHFKRVGAEGEENLWGIVTGIKPDARLEITGSNGVAGACMCVMIYELADHEEGTRLTFSTQGIWGTTDEMARMAREHGEKGWQELLGNRLKAFVERGERLGFRR